MKVFGRTLALIVCLAAFFLLAAAQEPETSFTLGLNVPGDVLVSDMSGKKLGFDPRTGETFEEITGGTIIVPSERGPVYQLPVGRLPFLITVSGRKANRNGDLAIITGKTSFKILDLGLSTGDQYLLTVNQADSDIGITSNTVGKFKFKIAIASRDRKRPNILFEIERGPGRMTGSVGLNFGSDFLEINDALNVPFKITAKQTDATGRISTFNFDPKRIRRFWIELKQSGSACIRSRSRKAKCVPVRPAKT